MCDDPLESTHMEPHMGPYNKLFGPNQALIATIDGTTATQAVLFRELTTLYKLTEGLEHCCDYFKVDTIDAIEYFSPNNEDWGGIIAVSWVEGLAVNTMLYEIDDLSYPDSAYAVVVHDGMLKYRFDTPE